MTTSIIVICLTALFGGALVFAAFNMDRLIAWENRVLDAWADSVRDYRLELEEEQRLLQSKSGDAPVRVLPKRVLPQQHRKDHAA